MKYKIKCPFCSGLNETDNRFCIHCGKKLPTVEGTSKTKEAPVSCPVCHTPNLPESIECKKCGHLLKESIKKTFSASNERKYRRCPKCGNILLSKGSYCTICGYDFSDLKIDYDTSDGLFNDFTNYFFKNHPECEEYRKNLDFFKDINRFNKYDEFLFQFKDSCTGKNIDLSFFEIGMIKCPQCSDFFSFISPHFIRTHKCPHCNNKFDFDSNEAYCLNCGRPVKDNQTKCACGYEFAEMTCPYCRTSNSYTNKYCISCGKRLIDSDLRIRDIKPRGCTYVNNRIVLDWKFLKEEIVKNPHQRNKQIYTEVLQSQYSKHERIIKEISSRWWIVSPDTCKSCQSKIEPPADKCPRCKISHLSQDKFYRIKDLKTFKDHYAEAKRSVDELSSLKWTYDLSETDTVKYLKSLVPMIGEFQLEYKKRLLKEWEENSIILYLIKSEWNIYFKNTCINCGSAFEKYNVQCPSCGMKKDVPALSVWCDDEAAVTGKYGAFSEDVKQICQSNGGDIKHFDDGIIGCPKCSNYFHYWTPDFVNTHRCPHCGLHFNITATISQNDSPTEHKPYEGEWELYGMTEDMWENMILEDMRERREEMEERFKDRY